MSGLPSSLDGMEDDTSASSNGSSVVPSSLSGMGDDPVTPPVSLAQQTRTVPASLPSSLDGMSDDPMPVNSTGIVGEGDPLALVGATAQGITDTIGKVAGGIGDAYNWATGTPTASTAAIANAPKTAIEGAVKLEQVPENLAKRGLGWMEGLDTSQEDTPNQTTIPGQAPSWHDLIYNGIQGATPAEKEAIAKNLGAVGELLGDPMWFLHLGGVTQAGKEAIKTGMLEPNIGKAGQAGQRALLTLGNTPIIKGKPILSAIGAAQTGLRKVAPGFHTMTEDPEFNAHAERTYIAPGSNAEHVADVQGNDLKKTINATSKTMGIDPPALNQMMIDYREPPGTVGKDANPETIQQFREQSQLPQNIKDVLDKQIEDNKSYAISEGKLPSDNYLHHVQTPEWQKFKDEHFNQQAQGAGSSTPKSDAISADMEREIENHGVNQANELSQQGRLGDLFPGNPFQNTLNSFKGKIFSDDLPHIEANRAIQNANVLRTADFMQGAKKFAVKPSEIDENPKLTKNYSPVDSPHFEDEGGRLWFPKEHADFINGLQNPKLPDLNRSWVKGFAHGLENTSTLTKLVNFGLKPASAPFNYLSNLNLQYLNKLFSAKNVAKGLNIISKDRMGKLSDKNAIYSPAYKRWISEKELMQKAHEHRGIGMGLERSEIANARMPEVMRGNPVSKGAMAVHMFAEDASRLPAFMTALERGSTWEGAAKQTREALYDYSDLGPADKGIAKYVPFWRFARMNMPKMVERMISEPARTTVLERARENWNQANGQQNNENNLAGYKREEEPWYAGKDENGNPRWVEGGRYMTQNDINRPVGSADVYGNFHPIQGAENYAAGMINPFIKTPFEEVANKNFANNVPIAQDEQANGGLGEYRDLMPGLKMPAKIEYALNQLSPFSMVRAGADQTVPWEYRLLHELGGVNAFSQQPDVDQEYNAQAVKKGVNNLDYAIKIFARKYASDSAAGKDRQAELDKENLDNAIEEQQRLAPKALGGLQ